MSLSQLHDNYCSDVEVLKIVIRNDKRNGLLQSPVGDQKVSVAGDHVGGVPGIRLRGQHLDAVVQLVALASLDEEQLGFAGKTRALIRREGRPQTVVLVWLVTRKILSCLQKYLLLQKYIVYLAYSKPSSPWLSTATKMQSASLWSSREADSRIRSMSLKGRSS